MNSIGPSGHCACLALLGAACLLLTGCGPEYCARNLLGIGTGGGKIALAWTGTAEQLILQKRIDRAITVEARDGTNLDVWVINARDPGGELAKGRPEGTVIILHGVTASKAFYLSLGERLARMNYDVILPDLRSHGRSGGKYVTWGAMERRDVKTILDRCLRDSAVREPVAVVGVSMGAAVAIDYAADDPRCKAVLAVAPPKDIRGVAHLMCRLMGDAGLDATVAKAGEIGGFDPRDASAVESAKRLKCPLLLVHGRLDMIVPFEHSQAILAAVPGDNKQLIEVPCANHMTVLWGREQWFADQLQTMLRTGSARTCQGS